MPDCYDHCNDPECESCIQTEVATLRAEREKLKQEMMSMLKPGRFATAFRAEFLTLRVERDNLKAERDQLYRTLGVENQINAIDEIGRLHGIHLLSDDVAARVEELVKALKTIVYGTEKNGRIINPTKKMWQQAANAIDAKIDVADRLKAEVYEECAKICDEQGREWASDSVQTQKNYAAHCADAIRAASPSAFEVKP